MEGKRIFERFGINLPKSTTDKVNSKLVVDFESWIFPSGADDWINLETDETLTGYLPLLELFYLHNECINKELFLKINIPNSSDLSIISCDLNYA